MKLRDDGIAELPPHSVEAEQSLLGGLLLDNSAWDRIADQLSEVDFYRDDHRRIFAHISKLLRLGQPADVVTVFDSIKAADETEQAGGFAYLGEIANSTPSAANIRRYAEIVHERAFLRKLQLYAHELIAACGKPAGRSAAQISRTMMEALLQATDPLAPAKNQWAADEPDISALAAQPVPEPVSLVGSNWLPEGAATLFHGDGGLGKSRHAIRLAICGVTGQPWFELPTRRLQSVVYVSCEDGGDALHRRLKDTCRAVGVTMDRLIGHLHILDRHRRKNTIWTERDGLTQDAHEFGRYAHAVRAELVIYDGLMDAFAGNVNDPAQAKAAVNAFLSILPTKCALLIVGHVSKEAARSKLSEAAGTQGWNNSVRARWAMVSDSDDSHLITLAKANEGPQGQQVKVRWSDEDRGHVGFLLTNDIRASLERGETRRIDDEMFGCVADLLSRGVVVLAARTGVGVKAYDVLSASPKWRSTIPDTTAGRKTLYASLARLVTDGRLRLGSTQTASRHTAQCYELPVGKCPT